MPSTEIRQRFLDFFEERGHAAVPSASLVPVGDRTLLFTNAGMVPFKEVFLGRESRPYRRATSVQKVLRVSGKHNDLEEVGRSPRHHTFFEMLGNFSFGAYYKADAIRFAWDLLTRVYEIPVERLWFTVFGGDERVPPDDEAARLWQAAGADPSRILRFGHADNFWEMGESGPCGPSSEIHVYIGDDLRAMRAEGVNSDDPDYVEIWNLVFMQFDRVTMEPLPQPAIDTGMSLERLAMVLQGVDSTYDTDLFRPLIARLSALTGVDQPRWAEHRAAQRAIADHARACAFLIADGVMPDSTGRGYVLRRLLRRAAYHSRTIGLTRPFLSEIASVVIDLMGTHYPELDRRRDVILETIATEEERFSRTIRDGMTLLDRTLRDLGTGEPLPGGIAFALYDTHGFPLDLTRKMAGDRGREVDEAGFEAAMQEQRRRGRLAGHTAPRDDGEDWTADLPTTEFTGYTSLIDQARILALRPVDSVHEQAPTAQEGETIDVVLDRTACYAEGGGQIGDRGHLRGPDGTMQVMSTRRSASSVIVHRCRVITGTFQVGDTVEVRVDADRRLDTARNHTATHLLHRALHDLLGEHAAQAGSLVTPDRLRFDFHQTRPLTPEQLGRIRQQVNQAIRANLAVRAEITTYRRALDDGAIALFGEKYGDRVRLVTIGAEAEESHAYSRELCGGTHVERTGEIGAFRIISESGIGSGIRRIEALTGRAADDWDEQQAGMLQTVANRLRVTPGDLPARVEQLLHEQRRLEEERATQRAQALNRLATSLLGETRRVNDIPVLAAKVDVPSETELRQLGDTLRARLGPSVIVLGSVIKGKARLIGLVSDDLAARGVHAGQIVNALGRELNGSGGGRATSAQAGGRDTGRLDLALRQVDRLINIGARS